MKQRVYQVEVNDSVVVRETSGGVQFRVQFDVTIDALGHITLCDLNISNLSEDTIGKFFKRGSVLALKAGYSDNSDYIFRGIIRNVFRYRDRATTTVQVLARGGELEKAPINRALGKNAKLHQVLQSLADAMGYTLNIRKNEFENTYVTGYSMTGDPATILADLAYAWDFHWSIDGNKLVIFKQATGRTTKTRTINMRSGLEGIPEVTEVGADFSVRMTPSIKIGERIELDTKYKSFNFSGVYYPTKLQDSAGDGEYTIMKIVHSGDNYGDAWSTRCTGYSATAVVIN
ncbi:hypothetical protein NVP1248O_52 [Vibrio phage 1.248.O._10N.261.54.F1]|nr:hypothetical protein NVP1248O_52 [Vibrio phage 1.248.O._10N.261.54.F1]